MRYLARAARAFLLVLAVGVFTAGSVFGTGDVPRKVSQIAAQTVRLLVLVPKGEPPYTENTGVAPSQGSGFVYKVLDRESCEVEVLTARHVIGEQPRVQIVLIGGGGTDKRAARHPDLDIALLRAVIRPCDGFKDMQLASPENGKPVYLIGYPSGRDALTQHIDVALDPVFSTISPFAQLFSDWDGATRIWKAKLGGPGASGGPVINRKGQLYGVFVGRAGVYIGDGQFEEGTPVFIPVDEQMIEKLRELNS